jgi:anti-sigma factor RsiW
MKRTCARVQRRLPRLVEGELPAWRRRLVLRHVARCDACAAELGRQQSLADGLRELGDAPDAAGEEEPPEELLDAILERVHDTGIRARVAVPARGAVSGARPELSTAAVLMTLLVVYLVWRVVRGIVGSDDDV